MDLKLSGQRFVVTGAGSGFGRAVAEGLLAEGAHVLAVSRTAEVLEDFRHQNPHQPLDIIPGDVTKAETQRLILEWSEKHKINGILVNAGGPPAGGVFELTNEQWDEAYNLVVRWKIHLIKPIAMLMKQSGYGRILFIESVSVKQPVDKLVLSNALRPAVIGFAKTLSFELASDGVTVNVIAPGYHDTAAMQRLYKKRAELQQSTIELARQYFEAQIPVGRMAAPSDFASLALWLLSPLSFYVTGQTISHDGGLVKGLFG